MRVTQQNISSSTPMGANPVGNGVVFRTWAPGAEAVYVRGTFGGNFFWADAEDQRLEMDANGYWSGFLEGVHDGDEYKFWIVGPGGSGYKRDPYARELTTEPQYPYCNCVVRDPNTFPWHDVGFQPPPFNDLVVYQFHVGTYWGRDRESRVAKFLDVVDRLDYLAALGINAIEPLPVAEYASPRSQGYEGSDLFSPEMDFCVDPHAPEFADYRDRVNALLARRGQPMLSDAQLAPHPNQLKALIDLCHLSGIAVLFDLVYNHMGGQIRGQTESLWFYDQQPAGDGNNSQFFTNEEYLGPTPAIWKREVRQFLIDNAVSMIDEFHADGFRYDQVSELVDLNSNDGWRFCQDLTSTVRSRKPQAIQIAEYWAVNPAVVRSASQGGAGFDATWHDGLREAVRGGLGAAALGSTAFVDMDRIAAQVYPPGFERAWKTVQYVESHDEVYAGRSPRIPSAVDGSDHRWWYTTSRSRVGAGLVLTAPGIPMLFMGQEFLEDKPWSDDPPNKPNTLLWWDGLLGGDKAMADYLRFIQELLAVRRNHPALRGELVHVFHHHNANRVLGVHRWLDGVGGDVVVVASLNDSTFERYALGFPRAGSWREVFNSDVYENWVNPARAGNGGTIIADGPALHELPASAEIVIPANSLLVFAQM